MFGAATKSDVFFLAISIPVFFSMANGTAFRSVAVPALGRAVAAGEGSFAAVAQRLILMNAFGILAVTAVIGIAALFAWAAVRGAPQSTITVMIPFLIAILPMYAMTAMVEAVQGPLQVRGHFLVPGLLRLGLPVGIITGALMSRGASIYSTAIGGTVAAFSALGTAIYFLSKRTCCPGASPDRFRKTFVTRQWTDIGHSCSQNLIAAQIQSSTNGWQAHWALELYRSWATRTAS